MEDVALPVFTPFHQSPVSCRSDCRSDLNCRRLGEWHLNRLRFDRPGKRNAPCGIVFEIRTNWRGENQPITGRLDGKKSPSKQNGESNLSHTTVDVLYPRIPLRLLPAMFGIELTVLYQDGTPVVGILGPPLQVDLFAGKYLGLVISVKGPTTSGWKPELSEVSEISPRSGSKWPRPDVGQHHDQEPVIHLSDSRTWARQKVLRLADHV